ncbi:hypothetical protein OIU76_012996 [Salix suchowensis]|nr:hypothetical protein OIU76_012996 [Salix suchowensis]
MTEKPIPRSNVMLTDGQGNQLGRTNWQLAGFSSGCEQDVSNYSGVAQHADQNDQLVRNGGDNIRNADIGHEVTRMGNNTGNHIVSQTPGLNSSLLASILAYPNIATFTSPVAPPSPSTCMVWRPSFPNLHAQVDGCGEPNLLVGNQARCWNLLSSSNISSQTHYEHPTMPCLPSHDLNSSPRIEADAASSVTTSFKSAAVVPDQAKRLENSSSEVISTPFEGEKDLARLDEQGIDLNKTPQKQPPKRRKHRPKVIVEDKPKRTPKVATTKNTDPKEKSTEKRKYIRKDLKEPAIQQTDSAAGTTPPSSAKRKYVRKKGLDESATQHTDSIGETINTRPVKRKYVRKKGLNESANQHADYTVDITHSTARRELRFDLETTTDERYSNAAAQEFMLNKKRGTSDLNTSLQVADSSTTTSQMNQLNSLWVENQQSGATSNQAPFMNQMQSSYTTILERQVVAAELTQRKIMHMENLNGNAKDARGPVGSLADDYHQSSPGMGCLEVQKRYKTENGTQANTLSMSSRAATAKYPGEWYVHSPASQNLPKQCISFNPFFHLERTEKTNGSAQVHNSLSPTTLAICHNLSQTPLKTNHASDSQLQPGTCNTEMSRIQQMSGATVSIPIPSGKGRVQQQPKDILERASAAISEEKRETSKAEILLRN